MFTVCPACGAELETFRSVDDDGQDYCQDFCVRCDWIGGDYYPDPDSDEDA